MSTRRRSAAPDPEPEQESATVEEASVQPEAAAPDDAPRWLGEDEQFPSRQLIDRSVELFGVSPVVARAALPEETYTREEAQTAIQQWLAAPAE
jgi:hypothetical protein